MCKSSESVHRQSRRVLSAAVACAIFLMALGVAADETKTVRLTIDYGDGVQKVFVDQAWQPGQTVLSALQAAAKHPRGIKFEHRGSGSTALVTSIDGLKNEAAGRSWLYEVNGKLADKSCGAWPLEAGDAILWHYRKYE